MSESVVDASALLAFLTGEDGAGHVERALEAGAVCGTVNWSEVAQKIRQHGRNWELCRALLLGYRLQLEPVTAPDAEAAAELWRAGSGLSIADRLCLALARRLEKPALTADRRWGAEEAVHQIR